MHDAKPSRAMTDERAIRLLQDLLEVSRMNDFTSNEQDTAIRYAIKKLKEPSNDQ